MSDVLNQIISQAIGLHKQGRFNEAEVLYNRVLNRQPFHEDLLFLLSDLYLRKDFNALGINLLSGLLSRNPNHSSAWCNLGVGYRKENDYEQALACWKRGIQTGGETLEVCNNIASLYADRAEPHQAMEWLGKALRFDPQNTEANWLRALALLTLKQWDEGWKAYSWRMRMETWDGRKSVDAPLWDGRCVDHLYIHGEQGVGDEIMFASAIPKMLGKAKRVTLEVNAKVAGICKQTWPDFKVVKEELSGKYDAKVPIGSLVGMFGTHTQPYLEPHPEKVEFYRRELEKLGPGPYLALTWIGGTKKTRVEDRSFGLGNLKPLMSEYTCVSAQYHDDNPMVEDERICHGLAKISNESTGLDLHDQAALFKAVDAVVTVQQTAVHVAGAVGAKTFALIGSKPHWRYGIEGDSMPFYSSVRLYRKKTDWTEVIERVRCALESELQRTEPAAS